MTRVYNTCETCGEPIYLNTHPDRAIDCWVHSETGSRHCGAQGIAVPQPTILASTGTEAAEW